MKLQSTCFVPKALVVDVTVGQDMCYVAAPPSDGVGSDVITAILYDLVKGTNVNRHISM